MIDPAVGAATLPLATGLVLVGATRAARSIGLSDAVDLLVAVPIFAATQIIVTLLLAGVVLDRLDVATVLALNFVVTGPVLVFLRPECGRRLGARAAAVRLSSSARAQPLAAALAALAALALAWRVVLALVLPPYGYDALSFHLANVVSWLQAGRIETSPLNVCCAYYPQNGEVIATWPALLGGRQEYVDFVQIAAALVGAAAVAGIARVARLPASGSWIAAALFVLTPVLLAQANTAYVDVTFTAAAVASFYLVLRFLETTGQERWGLLGAAGLATGLCVGTKPTGVEFGAVIILPLLVRAAARWRPTWREAGLVAVLFALPVVVLGASWYLHSWAATGSPFYPMTVKFLGATVFAGTNRLNSPPSELAHHAAVVQPLLSWFADLHFWTKRAYGYGELLGGLGPVWSYFGAILVLAFAVYAWRRRRIVLWYFLVPLGLFFTIQPSHWLSRYTLPLTAAGAVAVAWAITASWRPRQLRLALGVAVFGLAASGAVVASMAVMPGSRPGSLGVKSILHDVVRGRAPVTGAFDPDYASIMSLPQASPIAVDLGSVHMISPLAGVRFQNQLLALPRRATLRAFVQANRVEYVVTRKGSTYDRQAQVDAARFTLLGGERVHTYRVEPGRGGG